MDNSIFLTTIIVTPFLFCILIVIGTFWCKLLPESLKSDAKFFLAPVFGLTSLAVFVTMIGKIIPVGNWSFILWLFITGLAISVFWKKRGIDIIKNTVFISAFSFVCGISVLISLFLYGGFNSHNDAYIYLTHSQWVQENSFNDTVTPEEANAYNSQIIFNQSLGIRMGGSYLIAFTESVFNLSWAYEAWPAVAIAALTSCCLAIGFLIKQLYPKVNKKLLMVLLTLPALNLGGLVFGVSYGFLPQVTGVAMGVPLLILLGFIVDEIAKKEIKTKTLFLYAIPCGLLFSGLTYAYSEIMPLVLGAIGIGFLISAFYFKNKKVLIRLILFGCFIFLISILLLNAELLRVYTAIKLQSGAVVGSPVEWDIVGFIAHTFGVHGGAWDILQWTQKGNSNHYTTEIGTILLFTMVVIIITALKKNWKIIVSVKNVFLISIFGVFSIGLLYYRFFVASPFTVGIGQSWSQFKISDWATGFFMAFFLLIVVSLKDLLKKYFNKTLLAVFVVCLAASVLFTVIRMQPIANFYQSRNIMQFYTTFRETVLSTCTDNTPIYLNLHDQDMKFRQMAVLFLRGKDVKSDWSDDGYISGDLPQYKWDQAITPGDCIVERSTDNNQKYTEVKVGNYVIYHAAN